MDESECCSQSGVFLVKGTIKVHLKIVFDKLYLMKELSHTNCKRKIFYIFVYKKILYLNLGRSENNFVKSSIIIQETQTWWAKILIF